MGCVGWMGKRNSEFEIFISEREEGKERTICDSLTPILVWDLDSILHVMDRIIICEFGNYSKVVVMKRLNSQSGWPGNKLNNKVVATRS